MWINESSSIIALLVSNGLILIFCAIHPLFNCVKRKESQLGASTPADLKQSQTPVNNPNATQNKHNEKGKLTTVTKDDLKSVENSIKSVAVLDAAGNPCPVVEAKHDKHDDKEEHTDLRSLTLLDQFEHYRERNRSKRLDNQPVGANPQSCFMPPSPVVKRDINNTPVAGAPVNAAVQKHSSGLLTPNSTTPAAPKPQVQQQKTKKNQEVGGKSAYL